MVRFNDRGLVPAVVQDANTDEILTLAYMNEEALARTLEGPDVWFFSRSRRKLWHKGETSGNYLKVRSVAVDCDGDSIVVKADPAGPACHTGERSCFHTALDALDDPPQADAGAGVLEELFDVIEQRRQSPVAGSYTASLFESGRPRIAQKVIEEAGESAIASLEGGGGDVAGEVADLLYHCMVLLSASGTPPQRVWEELRARRK